MFGQQAGPGAGGFGTSSPLQTTTTQGTGLFGKSTSFNFGLLNPTGGLFGAPAATTMTTTTFGSPSAGGGMFGGTIWVPSVTAGTFGMLSKPATSTTGGGLFGTTIHQPAATGMFGGAAATTFGNRPLFGGTSTASTGFGTRMETNTASDIISASRVPVGTTVKFQATTGSDTMAKNGTSVNINTKHQNITAMKEYEMKSVDELRMEDYLANRRGPQSGTTGPGPFGSSASTSGTTTGSPFSFGGTAAQPKQGFGATGGTFGFGAPAAAVAPAAATAVFGQSTGVIGSTPPAGVGTSTFGSIPNNTGGMFSVSAVQPAQSKPSFGGTNTSTGTVFGAVATAGQTAFGFGAQPPASGAGASGGTGLFGAKPTGFRFNFGATTTTTSSVFAPMMSTGTASTGLFGTKPAAFGSTGFGTPTTTASSTVPLQTITTVADHKRGKTNTVKSVTRSLAGLSVRTASKLAQSSMPRSQSASEDMSSFSCGFTPVAAFNPLPSRSSSAASGMLDQDAVSNLKSIVADVFSAELSQLRAQALTDRTFSEFSIQALWTENALLKEKMEELSSRIEELASENAKLQAAVQELRVVDTQNDPSEQ